MIFYSIPMTIEQYNDWLASYETGDFPGKRLGEAFQDSILRHNAIVDHRLYYQASPRRARQMILEQYVTT